MPVSLDIEKHAGEAPKVNHLALVTADGLISMVPGCTIMMSLPQEGSGLGNIIPFVLKSVKRNRLTFLLDGKEYVFTASKGISRAEAQEAFKKLKTKEK